jgi:hypothetical protein
MVGLGSAFRLPGLQKYLKDKLSLDVRKPDVKFTRLAGESVTNDPLFQENILTFPVAYGLALQGLGEARLITNLLPQEIRVDRLIRAKKPYAAAAAAALLLGTGALAWGYSANYSALNAKKIEEAIGTSKGAVDAASRAESAFTAKVNEVKATQNDVKAIIAGNDERLNWPRFEEIFSHAMPRPGANGNLTDPEQVRLWKGENNNGEAALQWFLQRQLVGVPIEAAEADATSEHPKHLAMVNVEAVYCRWVDDVQKFLDDVDAEVYGDPTTKKGFGENIADYMKEDERTKDEAQGGRYKPKVATPGGGWVVEVRGFTEHTQGKKIFMERALIKNLQRIDSFVKDEKKVEKYIPGVTDPVKGKVSHAFVYHVWQYNDALSNTFQYINQSVLDRLLAGSGGAAGGIGELATGGRGQSSPPPGSETTGQATPTAAPWYPILGSGGGAPGPSTGYGGGAGGLAALLSGGLGPRGSSGGGLAQLGTSTGGAASGGMTAGSMAGGAGMAGAGGATAGGPGNPTGRTRYEFVAMFVWREPALGTGDAAAAGK